MRRSRSFWLALLIGGFIATPSGAGLQSRHLPVSTTAKQPRILNVYTRSDRLYVAGQNLPTGEDVVAMLGDRLLEVLHGTDTLLVAALPELPLDQDYELVIRRGVREASVRGSAVTWGFVLPEL
jgi:hypothetical protein